MTHFGHRQIKDEGGEIKQYDNIVFIAEISCIVGQMSKKYCSSCSRSVVELVFDFTDNTNRIYSTGWQP